MAGHYSIKYKSQPRDIPLTIFPQDYQFLGEQISRVEPKPDSQRVPYEAIPLRWISLHQADLA